MITKIIYTSSNKPCGTIDFNDTTILIKSKSKPELIIDDKFVLANSLQRTFNKELIKCLYDTYLLTIGEIACILDVLYYKANKWIKLIDVKTNKCQGRRNASYGKKFSQERKNKIVKSHLGRVYYNNGFIERLIKSDSKIPEGFIKGRLPFKNETKEKIRQAALSGKYLSPSERARRGWKRGKFKNVNFKKGISGYFSSKKTQKRIFFRSLLELYYLINYLENNTDVKTFIYEPFSITCDDGTLYTPDFLINDGVVVELKSYRFIYKQGGKIQEKFEYKKEQALKYCQEHDLKYVVVFDEDIDFSYEVLKHQLQDNKFIQEYSIEFLQPERVWSRLK